MATLFHNRYRVPSARLQTWDYSNTGLYFVTVCTANRIHYFGDIVHAEQQQMQLFVLGQIAFIEWHKTLDLRPDMNLELGEFVVMPNHIHGIVGIGDNQYNTYRDGNRDAKHRVSTDNNGKNQFMPQSKNLASIMRGYKSAVTTYARENSVPFNWQGRYHDHIIRSLDEYNRISNYIINNPANWEMDKFCTNPSLLSPQQKQR